MADTDSFIKMKELWSKSLNVTIGSLQSGTNFFDIGGDSLSALRLVKEINEYFQANVGLADIISKPATVASMQSIIDKRIGARDE